MTKRKNFRDWANEDVYEQDEEPRFKKKDSKRYDNKKRNVRNARKRKDKMKNSYFDG